MWIEATAAQKLWDEFLRRWPIESLAAMTIDQYTKAGKTDTFTYWLESKTESLGSIWGGSAFKFGIYHRDNANAKPSERGRVFGAEYAWYKKYGDTPAAAFDCVKNIIVTIAQAARAGRLTDIETADIGSAIKWKIAFLYQPKDHIVLLPIYKPEVLQALAGRPHAGYLALVAELMAKRGDTPIFSYAEDVWTRGKAMLDLKLTHEAALKYLNERFTPIKEPTKYLAGFETDTGRQLGLDRQASEILLFVEPGEWSEKAEGVALRKRYSASEPRNSNLAANVPRLALGRPFDKLEVPTLTVLAAFCDAYDGALPSETRTSQQQENPSEAPSLRIEPMMNKILYGPPGTGKTYKTAELAVEICDGSADLSREDLMRRYDELRREGRINFVTFHQSYGYEDFVEGLRPEASGGTVTYQVRRGIFRDACDAARLRRFVQPGLSGKPLQARTIYKMSLGQVGTAAGKAALQECLEQGFIVLGWGANIDFSDCKSPEDVRERIKDEPTILKPDSHSRYVTLFKDEVKAGDLIVVSQGNHAFRAIGEVTGGYQFQDPPIANEFYQMREVRWLAIFESNRPVSEIFDRNFMMSALYKLDGTGIKYDAIEALIKGDSNSAPQNHVLIIDEINRANISKVFGELITLLEPDKREGQPNEITLRLPYSGDDFNVPSNLFVVGTMNTADRSIALLDTALRRRFDFEELQPAYSALPVIEDLGVDLRALLQALNERIEYLFDRDHVLGHAYFLNVRDMTTLDSAFRRRVIPLLQEYFYEDWSKIRLVLRDEVGAFVIADDSVPKGLESTLDQMDVRVRYRLRSDPFPVEAYRRIYE